jgi:hypothetical protein
MLVTSLRGILDLLKHLKVICCDTCFGVFYYQLPEFKPNFLVKCAMQIGGDGFGISGPLIYSDNFFAGLKVHAII